MGKFFAPASWASLMIIFALLARSGWADRDAVMTLLLVMPILAIVSMRRTGCPGGAAREA